MKTKTIRSILFKKINDWLESIQDENVRKLAAKNTIITGGSIASLLMNEKPKDYDLYFRDKATTKAVAEYYCNKWNEGHGAVKNKVGYEEKLFVIDGADVEAWKRGEKRLTEFAPNHKDDYEYAKLDQYYSIDGEQIRVSHMITNTPEDRIKIIYPSDGVIGEPGKSISTEEIIDTLDDLSEIEEEALEEKQDGEKYRPVFLTTNAITLSNKIQIIIRFYGEPQEIHSNYDFVHCCCYYDNGMLVTPEESLLAIMNKDLFYRGSKYPICSMIRARKFIGRGWRINAGQYLKMAFQISELDLKDVDVLEDQLVGIDTLYFLQVVNAIRQQKERNPLFTFDQSYLASIIDRIF